MKKPRKPRIHVHVPKPHIGHVEAGHSRARTAHPGGGRSAASRMPEAGVGMDRTARLTEPTSDPAPSIPGINNNAKTRTGKTKSWTGA